MWLPSRCLEAPAGCQTGACRQRQRPNRAGAAGAPLAPWRRICLQSPPEAGSDSVPPRVGARRAVANENVPPTASTRHVARSTSCCRLLQARRRVQHVRQPLATQHPSQQCTTTAAAITTEEQHNRPTNQPVVDNNNHNNHDNHNNHNNHSNNNNSPATTTATTTQQQQQQ